MKVRFYLAQLNPTVGSVTQNANAIHEAYEQALQANAHLLITPECSLSGYQTEDLTRRDGFLSALEREIDRLRERTRRHETGVLLGTPYREGDNVFNAALHLHKGEIQRVIKKNQLPNYGVFDDPRIFNAGEDYGAITVAGQDFGVLICEDMWFPKGARQVREQGVQALLCLNASPFTTEKPQARLENAQARVRETGLPLFSVYQIGGQDEIVYDGGAFALTANGKVSFQAPYFQTFTGAIDFDGESFTSEPSIQTPDFTTPDTKFSLIYQALVLGLRDYAGKNGFKTAVLGVSGGVDSAFVAALAADALGAENVRALILPSQYTSDLSLQDAETTLRRIGIHNFHTLSIEAGYKSVTHILAPVFADLPADVTEENIQSRLRAILLNAYSNKFGSLLLSTGNKSEMAVGYATLYGDMCGGFNPVKDIYKTLLYDLCRYRNRVRPPICSGAEGEIFHESVLNKAPTAELRDNQKDSDSLPEYPVLDAILSHLIEEEQSSAEIIAKGFAEADVKKVRNLLFLAEYKRRQAPPGVKITEKSFGRDRRYPITSGFRREPD